MRKMRDPPNEYECEYMIDIYTYSKYLDCKIH